MILKKHLGWHDNKSNSSGVMASVLSSDAQALNGASAEGMAIQLEAMAALLWGLILSIYFSWPMFVCGLIITPFVLVASKASAKMDNKQFFNLEDEDEEAKKKASDILIGDTIQNYKTVQSFGND